MTEYLEEGTFARIKEAVAYTIREDIYLSLMGRFECADREARQFLSECILDRMLCFEPTMSAREYDQTLPNLLNHEYGIFTDGETYYLYLRDESTEELSLTEVQLKKQDYEDIAKEIRREIKEDEES